MAAYWAGGTPPRNTNVSVPRLTPDRKVRTITSSGPGSGSVTGRISPQPGARSQNACASACSGPHLAARRQFTKPLPSPPTGGEVYARTTRGEAPPEPGTGTPPTGAT